MVSCSPFFFQLFIECIKRLLFFWLALIIKYKSVCKWILEGKNARQTKMRFQFLLPRAVQRFEEENRKHSFQCCLHPYEQSRNNYCFLGQYSRTKNIKLWGANSGILLIILLATCWSTNWSQYRPSGAPRMTPSIWGQRVAIDYGGLDTKCPQEDFIYITCAVRPIGIQTLRLKLKAASFRVIVSRLMVSGSSSLLNKIVIAVRPSD